ncbi:MAG: hypothetical protein IPP50_11310 [Piscinibacter sp.]|nr:hypothetical protein [Piscinibacter sp.]
MSESLLVRMTKHRSNTSIQVGWASVHVTQLACKWRVRSERFRRSAEAGGT